MNHADTAKAAKSGARRPAQTHRLGQAVAAVAAVAAIAAPLLLGAPAHAQGGNSSVPQGIKYEQRLDALVPQRLPLVDEHGRNVHPVRVAEGRPVVLALVYFDCPMLCNLVVDGLVRSLKPLSLVPGQDFDVVIASIEPTDEPKTARQRERHTLARYGRGDTGEGWHFLTGAEQDVRALADAVGFQYRYLPETGDYAHPAGIVFLTPEGRISRYLLGVEHTPRDVRLALVEAGRGEIGSPVDQLLLLCFRYDPTQGTYGFYAMNVIRASGVLVLAGLAVFVGLALRRDRRLRALGGVDGSDGRTGLGASYVDGQKEAMR